jgi:hypothetical protein
MIRIVIAFVLFAHGVGHSLGLLQMFKVATVNPAWNGESWLLTHTVGPTVTEVVGLAVWAGAIVGFSVLAAIVLGWLPVAWFAPVAIAAAFLSIAGVLLFPVAFPTFSTLGSLAVDAAVLVAIAWYHWVPTELAA